jgi:hypothetical protein
MSIRGYSEADFGKQLQHYLRPSKPVIEPTMLRGRAHQLALIRQALYAEGRSVFIYGERGVGKSSVARIAATQYRNGKSDFPYILCEPSSRIESVLVSVARAVGITDEAEQTRSHRITARIPKLFEYEHHRSSRKDADRIIEPPSLDACVELAQQIARAIGSGPIVVVDEFDTIADVDERRRFGELIKRLGDRDVALKFILSGIGSSLDDLLGGHPSSIRQLHTVELDRLSWDARWEIIQSAMSGMAVQIDRNMMIRIAAISGGFPHYVHLVTEKLLWRMFADSNEVHLATDAHYRGALDDAVESVAPQLKEPYLRATQRASEDYRDAIWATADAYDLQRHTSRIFDSYLRISKLLEKAPLKRQRLLTLLSALKSEKYGAILRGLPDRAGWYEFRENMLRGFVRLVAEQHGVELQDQSADAPKQLTARVPNIRSRQAYRVPRLPDVKFRGEPSDN